MLLWAYGLKTNGTYQLDELGFVQGIINKDLTPMWNFLNVSNFNEWMEKNDYIEVVSVVRPVTLQKNIHTSSKYWHE